ncbi:hypothetical protein IU459_22315 [Nocardia amamiensis]|uniref:TY-Chap N-terminal domain-containing protein n=1 Tax=Nocardia amamiensis TaxID=404578 RepID=A0ABS0CWL0_9NOCA|nr:hypothetical protein [Nocardia amamiensis]MBF6300258.1 hypothetical protein [Nocardia amamiensis]
MTSWSEFADGLAEHLATLPAGVVVTIGEVEQRAERRRIAQFRQLDDMIWAELAGDYWLDPDVQAGEIGARLITEAGWQQPDADHCNNWWYELLWPANSNGYRRLASMIVTGLRDAFRIADPASLEYDAWNERADNRKIELPRTGLIRRADQ